MTSPTSDYERLVLFIHRGDQWSEYVLEELDIAREAVEDDLGVIAVMDVQYCNAVTITYDIKNVPYLALFKGWDIVKDWRVPQELHRTFFVELLEPLIEQRRHAISFRHRSRWFQPQGI